MKSKWLKYVFLVILIIYLSILILFALNPHPEKIIPMDGYDKVAHFAEFFILALLLWKTFSLFKIKKLNNYFITFISCIVVAIVSEYVQKFIPSRTSTWLDFLLDIGGTIFALIVIYIIKWES
ncbi:MAG: VanZ family protein [Candidatus Woesearchaeota archaeon]